jgi:chemotaxis protein methyltransferase CheR
VTGADFELLRKLLRDRSGLVLAADKQYLAESRLLPIARCAGLSSVGELVKALRNASGERLATMVVEAMATKESFFFRDKTPFQQLREVIIPRLMAARDARRRIRIWCAAASTGQEPYSIAMTLKEMGARLDGWRVEIIASDLSNEVLARAASGLYSHFEVQRGLPIGVLLKYFSQKGELWQITPEIRSMVQFRQLNLLGDFAHLGVFDVVFCRNVLIYFDRETKTQVLERLDARMEADGYLVLGAPETVVGLTEAFRALPDQRGLYAPAAHKRSPGRQPLPPLRIVAPPADGISAAPLRRAPQQGEAANPYGQRSASRK